MKCIMKIESEQYRTSRESREYTHESKEKKEGEKDKELLAAAALERADFLIGEVKSSKKQMQNIMVHMQQVLAAIKALREQLQISNDGADDSSVVRDKKRVDELKDKIGEYKDELLKMKDELIAGYVKELQTTEPTLNSTQMQQKAEDLVANIMHEIEQ